MDKFKVPGFSCWFRPGNMVETPDNGVLYMGKTYITYMGHVEKTKAPEVQFICIKSRLVGLSCSPDWSENRQFATIDESRAVNVWCLETAEAIRGHRGHVKRHYNTNAENTYDVVATICYTKTQKIISIDNTNMIIYCLVSNKFTVYNDFFKRGTKISILKSSPYDKYIFAAGTRNGLILVFSIETMTVLHVFRAHDKEIVSLDWMAIDVVVPTPRNEIKESHRSSQRKKQIVKEDKQTQPATDFDASDVFDIYTYDENAYEFGTISDLKTTTYPDEEDFKKEPISNNEDFNFVEACQNLKDDILAVENEDVGGDDSIFDSTTAANLTVFGDCVENQQHVDETGLVFTSRTLSSASGGEPNDFLDECEKLKDFIVINKEEEIEEEVEIEQTVQKILLVSGAKENVVWIWDVTSGMALEKIMLPTQHKALLHTTFITVAWVDQNILIANDQGGNVYAWDTSCKLSADGLDLKFTAIRQANKYPVDNILDICKALPKENEPPRIWCNSLRHKIFCIEVKNPPEIVSEHTYLGWGNLCLQENSLDSNLVAIGSADKKIVVLNLSNICSSYMELKCFSVKIQNKVMCLDWHPINESLLAFATIEGRIGVIDTNHENNSPILMKSFTTQEVYSIKWCNFTNAAGQKQLILFCTSKDKCAYYLMCGPNKFEPVILKRFLEPSSCHSAGDYLFIGTQDGCVHVNDLNDSNLKELYYRNICKKYITHMDYKNNVLAVASNDNTVKIIDLTVIDDKQTDNIRELAGHALGICTVRWSRGDNMLLLSASWDSTIRVWNTAEFTLISTYLAKDVAYGAIFSPLNENIVIYISKSATLNCYDFTKHPDDKVPSKSKQRSKHPINASNFKLATQEERPDRKARPDKKPKSVIKIVEVPDAPIINQNKDFGDEIAALTDGLQDCSLQKAGPKQVIYKLNLPTLFGLSYREINQPEIALNCVTSMLSNNCSVEMNKENCENNELALTNSFDYLNQQIFADAKSVKNLVEAEISHQKQTKSAATGSLLLHQINSYLKEEIIEKIAEKTLTEEHISLAPSISNDFWRKCCEAYAYQCLEKQNIFTAIPYLLACFKLDVAIDNLCKYKFYREAWIICKLRKEPDDKIFENIASEWAGYLEKCGNLEAASVIWSGVHNYKSAVAVLLKRKEMTEQIQKTIALLESRIKSCD